jgi:hypothetical protein
MPAPRPAPLALAAGVALLALALHARHLASGVDLYDETIYVVLPYRFVLGDRPFVDEINPIQTAALVTTPLVRALVALLGGTEGLVLATRLAMLAVELGVAALAFAVLRARVGVAAALVIAVAGVVLAPRPADLGYASLLSTLLTAGLLLAVLARERARPGWLAAAGATLGLACVAFPPAVLALAASGVGLLRGRAGRWVRVALLAGGALAMVLLFAPALADVGPATLGYTQEHLGARGTWTRRLARIPEHAWAATPIAFVLGLVVVAALALARGVPARVGALLAGALPLLASVDLAHKSGPWSTALVALAAPIVALPLRREPWMRTLLLAVWAPAALVGLAQAYLASSGVPFAGHALAPAALVTLAAASALGARAVEGAGGVARALVPLLAPCAFAVVLLRAETRVQNEAPPALRTQRVASGPFRGLATTPAKRALLEGLGADLAPLDDGKRRLLCYFLFPAGYLMTTMRPAADNAWGLYCYPARNQHECLAPYVENLARFGGDGVVVVRLELDVGLRGELEPEPSGPADAWIRARYRCVVDRAEYDVLVGD